MKADVSGLRETEKSYARRENGFHQEIAVIDPATGRVYVTARIYWPGSVAYCALWIQGANGGSTGPWFYGRGQGKAGGY
ncbi:hypothetical protein ABTC39_20430, partial [Acinetobacter baumannii]